jgi:hypothetical protein
MSAIIPHATRTSLRLLLLRRGVDVPPVRELTMRANPRWRHSTPAFQMRWQDRGGKHHIVNYCFRSGRPWLEVDSRDVPITMEEVRLYRLYKEKE